MNALKRFLPWLIVIGVVYFLYKRFFSGGTSTGSQGISVPSTLGNVTLSGIDPASVKLVPPPGYTGSPGGPYRWGGVGDPPSGIYETPGVPESVQMLHPTDWWLIDKAQ